MIYRGNLSDSDSAHYKDRRFTHTAYVHGRKVDYYDCWTNEDEHKPAFGEELNKEKVKALDSIFNDIRSNLGGTVNLDEQ